MATSPTEKREQQAQLQAVSFYQIDLLGPFDMEMET